MSLTAVTVPSTPWFNSGSISFSEFRLNFKETSSGEVKASELIRNTSTSLTNPIVPDATENASVASSQSNWKTSQFRNTIKYYNLNQPSSDTDTNLNIAAAALWNSNLGKNIVKTVTLAGTSGSTTTGTAAASLDASAVYNVLLLIDGSILGDGGSAGTPSSNGGNGGDALYINTNGTGTVTVRATTSSSRIYGGGGGGGGGGRGGNGGNGYYPVSGSYTQEVGGSGGQNGLTPPYWMMCRQACKNKYGNDAYCVANCYKIPGQGGCGYTCWSNEGAGFAECEKCFKTVYYSYNVPTDGGTGGAGANGGVGEGYLQSKTSGGTSPNFGYTNGPTYGGTNAGAGGRGGNGGDGGNWGADGDPGIDGDTGGSGNSTGGAGGASKTLGGTAGRAVSGSGYTIDTTNGVSGAYRGNR